MNPDCPFVARVVDFTAGELTAPDQREFENHLPECAGCRDEVASYRQIIAILRSLPVPETSENLARRVFANVRAPHRGFSNRQAIWLWSAAAVALLAFVPFFPRGLAPAPPASPSSVTKNSETSLDRGINWLCANQEADGSWDAEKWGGLRNFEVALTALPAIAVIGKNFTTPERAAVASRAIAWLRVRQSDDGTFGPDNVGVPYNHSIATLALLHAYRLDRDSSLKRQIDSAIAAMVRAQGRDGGWAWRGGSTSDKTITGWHLEALRLAHELKLENSKVALDRGLAWVAAHPDQGQEAAPANVSPGKFLTQSAATPGKAGLDICGSYFLTVNLQREKDEESRRQLAAIRRNLVLHQVPVGNDSGSWPPDDSRGCGGGRIYSTALASLSLEGE